MPHHGPLCFPVPRHGTHEESAATVTGDHQTSASAPPLNGTSLSMESSAAPKVADTLDDAGLLRSNDAVDAMFPDFKPAHTGFQLHSRTWPLVVDCASASAPTPIHHRPSEPPFLAPPIAEPRRRGWPWKRPAPPIDQSALLPASAAGPSIPSAASATDPEWHLAPLL